MINQVINQVCGGLSLARFRGVGWGGLWWLAMAGASGDGGCLSHGRRWLVELWSGKSVFDLVSEEESAWVMRIDIRRYDLLDIFSRIEGTLVSGTIQPGDWRGRPNKTFGVARERKGKAKGRCYEERQRRVSAAAAAGHRSHGNVVERKGAQL